VKIIQLTVEQKRLSTAEAELWVIVHVEKRDEATELRGVLSGPRCTKAETIQLAYPLKPIALAGYADNVLAGRIVIPEPNCWTPEMPFIYEGKVELWHGETCADSRPIRALFKAA
jgi:hypothetical protein